VPNLFHKEIVRRKTYYDAHPEYGELAGRLAAWHEVIGTGGTGGLASRESPAACAMQCSASPARRYSRDASLSPFGVLCFDNGLILRSAGVQSAEFHRHRLWDFNAVILTAVNDPDRVGVKKS